MEQPASEIRVTMTHMATSSDPSGTECWVVEGHNTDVPTYWTGYFFEQDFSSAVRFCREEDAERVRENFSRIKRFKSVRHVWL